MIVNYPRMRRHTAWPDDLDTALEFASTSSFRIIPDNATKRWDGTMEFCNGPDGWQVWDGSDLQSNKLNGKYRIYVRGTKNTIVSDGYRWFLSGFDIKCNGNIEKLLDWNLVQKGEHPTMGDGCFKQLFERTNLVSPPSLPATVLSTECYQEMFYNCPLKYPPVLPATTLAIDCYYGMFNRCSSLIAIPRLLAATLPQGCYGRMFYNCSKIKVSKTKTGTYTKAFRIPETGDGLEGFLALSDMFGYTGGTFTETPEINTTYYLDESNEII